MTLIEVLIAAAVFIVVSFALFEIVRHLALSAQRVGTQQHQRADLSHFLDELESDQQSAEAVFIPATDVLGNNNTPAHEIDFFTKDGANRPYYWAYSFDAAAHTVTRYNYATPGAAPIRASIIENVQTFIPSDHQISEVSDPLSPIYFPIFASATNYSVAVGAGARVQGGTHVLHLDLATKVERFPIDLAPASAPSGFTVVLNYTPRPAATPGKSLSTWPIAVAYGQNNTDVAITNIGTAQRDIAWFINAALGGGIAEAAGCHAIAFKDAAMKLPDANNSTFAALGVSTDGNGCYSGAIVAYEPAGAATVTFTGFSNTCGLSVSLGALSQQTSPQQMGSFTTTSGPTITGCDALVADGSGKPQTIGHGDVAAAVWACRPVVIAPSGGAYCLWYGGVASGFVSNLGSTYNSGTVWYYDDATSPGPNMDCSGYADSGSCTWNQNGAVAYCFQGTSPPSAPMDYANPAGFTCADRGSPPTKPWPTIPCTTKPAILCKGAGSGGGPRV